VARKDIEAGKSFVELYLKQSKLVKGLQAAKQRMQSFGKNVSMVGGAMAGAGTAIITPLIAAAAKFAEVGSELSKISVQTGASVTELGRLKYAAEQLKVDPDDLTGAIEEMNIRLGETVKDGVGPMAEALDHLGIDPDQLNAQSVEQRLGTIGDALKGVEDDSQRAFLADELLGGDAFKMLPMLMAGAKGMKALGDEAEGMGLVMDEASASSAVTLSAAWSKMQKVFGGIVTTIGSAVAPVLVEATAFITQIALAVRKWVSENKELFAMLLKVGGALVIAGSVIAAVGVGIAALGTALGGIATFIGIVGAAVTFLLSPFGLIATALVVGAVLWVKYTDSGQRAFSFFLDSFKEMLSIAKQTFGGIFDAIVGGDLALAGQIAITGLRVMVLTGLVALSEMIGGVWGGAVAGIGGSLMRGDVSGAWKKGIAMMSAAWKSFVSWVIGATAAMGRGITKTWAGAVKGTANWMLQTSAKGGAMGKAMSAILGVDMQEQQKRSDSLHSDKNKQAYVRNLESMIPELEARLVKAQAGGDTKMVSRLLASIARTRGEIESAGGSFLGGDESQDVVKGAMDLVAGDIDQKADSAIAAIDAWQEKVGGAADAARDEALGELAANTSGDLGGVKDELGKAQAALDKLTADAAKKAKKKRDEIKHALGGDGGDPIGGGGPAAKDGGVAVSFSAAALVAMAGGGETPAEKLRKEVVAHRKLQKDANDMQLLALNKLDNLGFKFA